MLAAENSDLMLAAVPGIAVALFSFGLARLWDHRQRGVDTRERRRLALCAFVAEMEANSIVAGNVLNLLGMEQRARGSNEAKTLVNPLSSLETGAWPVARLDLDVTLLADRDLVRRLQIINRNTLDINSLVQSREQFRLFYLRDDQLLAGGLDGYGNVLIHLLRDLRGRHEEAIANLRPYTRSRPWKSGILDPDSAGVWMDKGGGLRGPSNNPISERPYRWFGWLINNQTVDDEL